MAWNCSKGITISSFDRGNVLGKGCKVIPRSSAVLGALAPLLRIYENESIFTPGSRYTLQTNAISLKFFLDVFKMNADCNCSKVGVKFPLAHWTSYAVGKKFVSLENFTGSLVAKSTHDST